MLTDIDECSDGSNSCEQICTNSDGGYTCSCVAGTELAADKISCRSKGEMQY